MTDHPARASAHPLSMLASLVVVFVGVRLAAPVAIPVLLALTIAVALTPLTRVLRSFRIPEFAATSLSILVVLLLLASLFALFVYAAGELTQAAPRLQASAAAVREDLVRALSNRQLEPLAASLRQVDLHERVLATALGTVRGMASIITTLFAVLVFTIFMILEAADSEPKLDLLAEGTGRSKDDWRRGLRDVQRYLVAKAGMSALTGALVWIWTLIWGIDGSLLWGVLAFVLNFIPVIGSIVAGVPAVTLALVDLGPLNALFVALGYVGVNVGVSNFLEPKVMGRTLGLSPLVVLFSVLLWGFVLGPVGALLSVPLTMAAKIVLERSQRYGWVSRLMEPGSKQPRRPLPPG